MNSFMPKRQLVDHTDNLDNHQQPSTTFQLNGNGDHYDLGEQNYSNQLLQTSSSSRGQRNRRSDEISGLMGQYLLRGWRMLNEHCPVCSTILFQPQQGDKYCIGCAEVDKNTVDSNLSVLPPPVNVAAASPQTTITDRSSTVQTSQSSTTQMIDGVSKSVNAPVTNAQHSTLTSAIDQGVKRDSNAQSNDPKSPTTSRKRRSIIKTAVASVAAQGDCPLTDKLNVKLDWCVDQLMHSTLPARIRQWTQTINCLIETARNVDPDWMPHGY